MTSNSWFKLPSFFSKQEQQPESNEKATPTSFLPSWLPNIASKKSTATLPSATATSENPIHVSETDHVELTTSHNTEGSIHNKDIVPLRQFLRYSINRSDQRSFQRRRITRPFAPKYEIEWQKNQWLQLDNSTNKQIEKLRRNGFTKIAIRKDACLKRHIEYSNPSEIDVLLEFSFISCSKSSHQDEPEPIVCHQPSQFSVRRTHWWRTNHQVAEAHLPDWVDPDLCCDAVVMDAPSVLAAMTDNYSRSSSSCSLPHQQQQHPKMPDTPIVSQKSSFLHLQPQQEDPWIYKPLQYNNPPFLMDKPALVIG